MYQAFYLRKEKHITSVTSSEFFLFLVFKFVIIKLFGYRFFFNVRLTVVERT
jgi:hypothetical protein